MSLSEQLINISQEHPEMDALEDAAFMLDHYESRIELLELTIRFLLAQSYIDPMISAFITRMLEERK
jgi:hypothetical protein